VRLAAYWAEALDGPRTWTDVALRESDPVRAVLHDYFAWTTTTTMSRYHQSAEDVPDGLRAPQWSWDSPQR